jgi:transposase
MSSHQSSYEIVGIDVAARRLVAIGDQAVLPANYENTLAGRGRLIASLGRSKGGGSRRPVRLVLEASGLYFLDLACDLAAAGIAVMVVNPKPAHHFAEAMLQRRKDAPVDAALTAARCCPEARALVDRLAARGKIRLHAVVAPMRKLLHGLHARWHLDEDFDGKKLFAAA